LDPELSPVPDAVLIGRLRREYILPAQSAAYLDQPGGNLAYAAMSLLLWGGKPGLVSRVNQNYPLEWLEKLKAKGADIQGIHQSSEAFDDRFFAAYSENLQAHHENPIAHFAESQLPFPQELLGYKPTIPVYCSKTDYQADSIRITDVPSHYLESSAAHISPIDFISHKILPSVLKGGLVQTLSMRACNCYMDPIFWEEIRALIADVTAFMITEAQALKLFQGRSTDLWEISEYLANYGPEYVLTHAKDNTVLIYSRLKRQRWILPAYPTKVVDPTGAIDAFDAGFLINYRKEYDVVQAALCGMVSASFCGEGSGPFFILEGLPELRQARLDVMSQNLMTL